MADINSKPATATRHTASLAAEGTNLPPGKTVRPRQSAAATDLVTFVELLFFAYRDFTGDADELLQDLGYGRAHHRVVHFVARHPGLRVADLLDILRITKQSLARVLKQLIDEGFITQQSGKSDRRERHLYLTQKGLNFAEKLTELQCARIGKALETIGAEGRDAVEDFLVGVISDKDRDAVTALVEKANQNDSRNAGRPSHTLAGHDNDGD